MATGVGDATARAWSGWQGGLALLLVSMLASGVAAVHLGQDLSWDLLNYHCYNAYAFLGNRLRFDVAPAQLQTYLNPVGDLPFYLLNLSFGPKLSGFLMGAVHGSLVWFVFLLAREIQAARRDIVLPWACLVVAAFGPILLSELGTSMTDVLAAIPVLASLYGVVLHLRFVDRSRARWALLAAAYAMGAAAGLKLTAVVCAVGATLALPFAVAGWHRRAEALLLWAAGAIAGFVSLAGYWMLRLWYQFGNPLFPFYNDVFRSPYWRLESLADLRWMPRTGFDAVLSPLYLLTGGLRFGEYELQDPRFFVALALLGAVILLSALRRTTRWPRWAAVVSTPAERFLIVFFVTSFVVWVWRFSIHRYLAPLEALAPVVVVVALRWLGLRSRRLSVVTVLVFGMVMAGTSFFQWKRIPWQADALGVRVPELARPAETLVVLAGGDPTSYVIPYFPPQVRFVRVGGNLTNRGDGTLLQAEMVSLIASHEGDLLALVSEEAELRELSHHGLVVAERSQMPVRSHAGTLWLVPMTHTAR